MLDELTTSHTLRRARELADLDERRAAKEIGVRRSVLRSWESGAAEPDAEQLSRAIAAYGRGLDEILGERGQIVSLDDPNLLLVGSDRVRVDAHLGPDGLVDNAAVLESYLAAVRRQRGVGTLDFVELRAADIASLAAVLDVGDDELQPLLESLLDLTPAGARWATRGLIVSALLALGTAGLLASGPLTANAGADTALASSVGTPTTVVHSSTVESPALDNVVVAPPTTETPAPKSPFTVDPPAVEAELAPAVFAVAPATEWSPRVVSEPEVFAPDTATAVVVERPALPPG